MNRALTPSESARLTRLATTASVGVALVLVAAKAAAWWASGSVALMASAADSGLDLLASLVTFAAVRYAAAPPDAEHRFGHGKAEAFAGLVQAGLVLASAALVAREALGRLQAPQAVAHSGWAMAAMVFSTLLTAALITLQGWVLRRTASVAVAGDRAHYASDLASNLLALAGVAAAALIGASRLDALAGLAVAALLIWSAVSVFRHAGDQLMDRELAVAERARIRALVLQDPRLSGVHQLRTRASGPYVHMQMHVDLDPSLNLREAHAALVAAEKRVLAEFPHADIIMHPDPRGAAEPHGGAFAEESMGKRSGD
jgi:cation diffusion facilitator family transporter